MMMAFLCPRVDGMRSAIEKIITSVTDGLRWFFFICLDWFDDALNGVMSQFSIFFSFRNPSMFYRSLAVMLCVLFSVCSMVKGSTPLENLRQDTEASSVAAADSMLIFSKTAGFRHDSIAEGITCFRELGAELGLKIIATEDASVFNSKNLSSVRVVIFLNTTGDILNAREEAAFESYIRKGGAWLGVHAAADTENEWEFYKGLVGA